MGFKAFCGGFFAGGVLGGGLGAATGAISGAVGASVLSRHYDGYNVSEATTISAVGNVFIGGIFGSLAGSVIGGCEIECSGWYDHHKAKKKARSLVSYVGGQVLGALAGYGLLGEETMSLGQIAASSATGAALMGIPATIALVCCGIGVMVCWDECKYSYRSVRNRGVPANVNYNHHVVQQQVAPAREVMPPAVYIPAQAAGPFRNNPPAPVIAEVRQPANIHEYMMEHKEVAAPAHVPARVPADKTFQARYEATGYSEDDIPNGFKDPISTELMQNPMLLTSCGHSFDEDNLKNLAAHHGETCPCCRVRITQRVPNVNLKQSIEDFVKHAEERKKQEIGIVHVVVLANDNQAVNAPAREGAAALSSPAIQYGMFARNQDVQRSQINDRAEGQVEGNPYDDGEEDEVVLGDGPRVHEDEDEDQPAVAPGGPSMMGNRL